MNKMFFNWFLQFITNIKEILCALFGSRYFLSIYSPRAGSQAFKKGCQRNPPGRSPMRIQAAEPCFGQDIFHDFADVSPFRGSMFMFMWIWAWILWMERCPRHRGRCPGRNMGLRLGSAWMGRSGGLRWHSFLLMSIFNSKYSIFFFTKVFEVQQHVFQLFQAWQQDFLPLWNCNQCVPECDIASGKKSGFFNCKLRKFNFDKNLFLKKWQYLYIFSI